MAIELKGIYKIGILPLIISLFLATLACSSSSTEPSASTTRTQSSSNTPTSAPANTPTPAPAVPTEKKISQAEADILRQLTFDYWDALNSYDVDKTLSYLEENYRQVHADEVKDGISQMKTFGVQLEASEESPPRLEGNGQGEMYVTLKEPIGTRRILMEFEKVGGEWKITFAEEVK